MLASALPGDLIYRSSLGIDRPERGCTTTGRKSGSESKHQYVRSSAKTARRATPKDTASKRSAEMMDLVDFGPLHILMRDDNSRISMLFRFESFLLIQINFAHWGRPIFPKRG